MARILYGNKVTVFKFVESGVPALIAETDEVVLEYLERGYRVTDMTYEVNDNTRYINLFMEERYDSPDNS